MELRGALSDKKMKKTLKSEGLTVVGKVRIASFCTPAGLIHFPGPHGKSLFVGSKVADFCNFARSRIRKNPYYICWRSAGVGHLL